MLKGSDAVGRILAAKRQQIVECNAELLFGVSAKILLDEGGSKTVKTGGHRRVRGEEIAGSRDGQSDFEGLPCLFHEAAGTFQDGKRRVPFIQVTDLRLEPERARAAAIRRSRGAVSCLRRNSGPPP